MKIKRNGQRKKREKMNEVAKERRWTWGGKKIHEGEKQMDDWMIKGGRKIMGIKERKLDGGEKRKNGSQKIKFTGKKTEK